MLLQFHRPTRFINHLARANKFVEGVCLARKKIFVRLNNQPITMMFTEFSRLGFHSSRPRLPLLPRIVLFLIRRLIESFNQMDFFLKMDRATLELNFLESIQKIYGFVGWTDS